MNYTNLIATYRQLADVTGQALGATQTRDWQRYAALQEDEDALLQALKTYGPLPQDRAIMIMVTEWIYRILADQQQTASLISTWQTDILQEINSTVSSKRLTDTYQTPVKGG